MDFSMFNQIFDGMIKSRSDLYALCNALTDDRNNADMDEMDNYSNARNYARSIILSLQILLERLDALGHFYDLIYEIENEEYRFLIMKKVDLYNKHIIREVEFSLKFIKTQNLIDYRLINMCEDIKKIYNLCLENIDDLVK